MEDHLHTSGLKVLKFVGVVTVDIVSAWVSTTRRWLFTDIPYNEYKLLSFCYIAYDSDDVESTTYSFSCSSTCCPNFSIFEKCLALFIPNNFYIKKIVDWIVLITSE